MQYVIVFFGSFIVVAALLMFVRPELFLQTIRRYSGTPSFHVLAILVRLLLGLALIDYSDQTRFPFIFQVLGALSIAAAAVIAVIPRAKFAQLVLWITDRAARWVWGGAVAALLFGVFLILAVSL